MATSDLLRSLIAPRQNPASPIARARASTARRAAVRVSMRRHSTTPASANLYDVLALESEGAGADAIRRAYRSMALRHHPDVCPQSGKEEATRRFIEIQRAYEVLSDPALRERYDRELGLGGADSAPGGGGRMRRGLCPREVWMEQLSELKARSMRREGKRRLERS